MVCTSVRGYRGTTRGGVGANSKVLAISRTGVLLGDRPRCVLPRSDEVIRLLRGRGL